MQVCVASRGEQHGIHNDNDEVRLHACRFVLQAEVSSVSAHLRTLASPLQVALLPPAFPQRCCFHIVFTLQGHCSSEVCFPTLAVITNSLPDMTKSLTTSQQKQQQCERPL